MEKIYLTVDILGTVAFAISGVLVAMEKRLDLFGVGIIALVTAIGGGTLRDMLIGNTPVTWTTTPLYMYIILGTVIVTILFQSRLKYLRTSLFLFDTIGIGFYTMIGINKGMEAGLEPLICITLGTITASFGGVLRDILCNEIPGNIQKGNIRYGLYSGRGGLLSASADPNAGGLCLYLRSGHCNRYSSGRSSLSYHLAEHL